MKLKNYILKHYPKINPSDVMILITKGKVFLNEKIIKDPNYGVKDTDVIQILLSKKNFSYYNSQPTKVYEPIKNLTKTSSTPTKKKMIKESSELERKRKELLKKTSRQIQKSKRDLLRAKKKIEELSKPLVFPSYKKNKSQSYTFHTNKKKQSSNLNKTKSKTNKKISIDKHLSPTALSFDQIIRTKEIKKSQIIKPLSKSRIIYEDANIVVINKLFNEALKGKYGRVDKRLSSFLLEKGEDISELKYHNWLDSDVKGLVLFTKTKKANAELNEITKFKAINSIYYAVCIPAPFLKDKKQFNLPLPFKFVNNKLVQVKEENKGELRRIMVNKIGLIQLKGKKYPILKITTNRLREASIRFVLTFYGMTIINDTKMSNQKKSNDILLFHSIIKFTSYANSKYRGLIIKLDQQNLIKKMTKILEKTFKN